MNAEREYRALYEMLEESMLGDAFPEELKTASRLWVQTGYGQGIAAYLNFFLLTDFIVTSTTWPGRCGSWGFHFPANGS